jgi:acetylornithine/succinyldiaminopimelate/putrescine aminotransferase
LRDEYGDPYIDFGSGGAVLATGHRDERVRTAISVQISSHVFKGGWGECTDFAVTDYAQALSDRFPPDADGNPRQVVFLSSSYEARLVASHTAAVQGVGAAFIDLLDQTGKPREGGELQDYVHQAKAKKARIVVDETLTGFGRTGTFCYAEQFGFVPDVTILGPAVGAGFPLVAVVAPKEMFTVECMRTLDEIMNIQGAANPVACAAGKVVLEQITDELLDHVKEMGRLLHADLDVVTDQFSHVFSGHEGAGLVRTLALREPLRAKDFRSYCRNAGLLIQPRLRITPPLNCTDVQIRTSVDAMAAAAINLGADMQPQEAPVSCGE